MIAGGRFLLLTALVVATGCAALRAGAAKSSYIEDQTRHHVYGQPIAQVWPGVRQLLFERGYEARDNDVAGSFAVETAPSFSPDGKTRLDYLVLGTKISEASCRVEFTKREAGPTSTTSHRDLDLEWLLLQRIDPQSAARIESEANQVARQARAE